MKKILFIALAIIGLQAIAQEPKREGRKNQNKMMMTLSAEEMATLQTKKMTLILDLNDSQQNEIKKINFENATKRKVVMAERKAKKESGKAKKPSQQERYAMAISKLDHMIATKAKMKKILNKQQFEKWETAQKRMAMNQNYKKKGSEKWQTK